MRIGISLRPGQPAAPAGGPPALLVILLAVLLTSPWACAPAPAGGGAVDALEPPYAPRDSAPAPGTAFLGVVAPRQAVDVASEVVGRVASVEVRVGDAVTRGQALASLDTGLLRQELAMAEAALGAAAAELRRAQVELEAAEHRWRRRSSLPESVSQEQLHAARLERDVAAAAVDAATALLAERRAHREHLATAIARSVIRAPFDGLVAARYLDTGATVAGGAPVVRVISTGGLQVRFAVPPESLAAVAPGSSLHLRRDGGDDGNKGDDRWLTAVVERVAPEVDAASQLVFAEARIEAPTDPGGGATLQAGTVVRVRPVAPP